MADKLTYEELELEIRRLSVELEAIKDREKESSEAATYYHAFFNHVPDGVVVLDPETTKPVDFNDQVCKQLGYTRDEFSLLTIQDIEAKENSESIENHIQKILRKKFDSFETLHRTKDGNVIHVLVIAQVIALGERLAYHCIWRDITEQKQAEEKILESQERYRDLYERSSRAEKLYRSLINSSADAIVIYNLEGEVQYISPSFSELFGWQLDEVVGKRIPFVPDSEKESTLVEILRVLDTGKPSRNFYTKRYTKDGRLLDIYISASKYDDVDGNPIGLLVILKDITDKIVMEKQLRQAHKMDALGTLAGGIAHDFNNILTAVMGLIEIEYHSSENESQTSVRMKKALSACDRAKDLIKQILTFSTQGEQQSKPFRMVPVIEDALNMLRATLPSTIEIHTKLEPEQALILGDPSQIHQILINLCANSAYAMRYSGGILEVCLKEITIDDGTAVVCPTELKPGPYLYLTVSDTGEGMDRGTIERIFEPFFSTKAPGEGAGIGLSMVHGIVKTHNGKIFVNSELGKGSIFEIFFPKIDIVEEQSDEFAEPLPTLNERILLVDDEEIVIEPTSKMLEIIGYQVVSKRKSSEALELFRSQPNGFHLIITDQTMPEMTGIEFATQILQLNKDIPIILYSGFSNENICKKAMAVGVRKIISKPFDMNELAASIREVLS